MVSAEGGVFVIQFLNHLNKAFLLPTADDE